MDFSFSADEQQFRREIREFLEEAWPPEVRPARRQGRELTPARRAAVRRFRQKVAERGWYALGWPAEYGGTPKFTPMERFILSDECSRIEAPLSLYAVNIMGPLIIKYGSPWMKEEVLPLIRSGEIDFSLGFTEPETGSDLANLQTRAVRDGDEYVINGQKIWTSGAREADMMFALVRTEADAGKHGGISYIVLSMDTPGIEVRPLMTMTGDASFNEVFFTDVRVPAMNVVGRPGQGWEVGTYTLRYERNMLGRSNATENYFDGCVDILRETGLIESPVYRDRLLKLEGRVQAMKYHQLRLLTDMLKKRDSGAGGLIVKLNNCQLNYDICALAIDGMAERGVLKRGSKHVRDYGNWQRNYMYALGLIIGGGTAQIQKNIIGERGLGLPREPKPAAA